MAALRGRYGHVIGAGLIRSEGQAVDPIGVLVPVWRPSYGRDGAGAQLCTLVVVIFSRSSARKYKEYALDPYCPACARDLVDCLSEKMFAGSKCKAEMEVEADE